MAAYLIVALLLRGAVTVIEAREKGVFAKPLTHADDGLLAAMFASKSLRFGALSCCQLLRVSEQVRRRRGRCGDAVLGFEAVDGKGEAAYGECRVGYAPEKLGGVVAYEQR